MEQARLVSAGSFCWNQDCPDYGRIGHGNIIKFGRTAKGTQRYRCTTCGRTFVETKGTVFYDRYHAQETILECLARLAERTPGFINRAAEGNAHEQPPGVRSTSAIRHSAGSKATKAALPSLKKVALLKPAQVEARARRFRRGSPSAPLVSVRAVTAVLEAPEVARWASRAVSRS